MTPVRDAALEQPQDIVKAASHDSIAAQLIERAIALRPKLLARQEETERLGRYPESTHQDLLDSGLYRIIQPKRFGGYECDIPTFLKVVMELARGCPSSAWCYSFGVTHQFIAAEVFPIDAQKELFATGECRISAGGVPSNFPAEKVDGGYHIRGVFGYGSGSPYSTHYIGGAKTVEGDMVLFVVPRSGYTLMDDWGDVLGMKGSGSNSVDVDAIVPDRYVLKQTIQKLAVSGGSIGSAYHDNSMYALPVTASLSGSVIVSVAVGAGWAALDEYKRAMATRTAIFTPNPDGSGKPPIRAGVEEFQLYLGDAFGKLTCAEAIVLQGGQMMMDFSRQNIRDGQSNPKWDDQLMSMMINAAEMSCNAVQHALVPTIGSTNIIRSDERMQRYVRDLTTIWSHRVISYRHRNSVKLGEMEMQAPPVEPA